MKKDSLVKSLFTGRLLAAVLAIGAGIAGMYGYTIAPEDLQTVETLVGSVASGVAGVIAIMSKVRESKK